MIGACPRPPFGERQATIFIGLCYEGDADAGREAIKPLLMLDGLTSQQLDEAPYAQVINSEGSPPPREKTFAKSAFVKAIDDKLIDAITQNFGASDTAFLHL